MRTALGSGSQTATLLFWNLLPVPGVLLFGWDPRVVLLLYWVEFYLRVVLNTPKIMLAEAGRTGRLPDDVLLWEDGPTVRLGTVGTGLYSLFVFTVFISLLTAAPPLSTILSELSTGEAGSTEQRTLVAAALVMLWSVLYSVKTEFVDDSEYERVDTWGQFYRPVADLWISVLLLLGAGGTTIVGDTLTTIIVLLVLAKTAGELLARRVVRLQPPDTEPFQRASPPDEQPEWTGQPAVGPLSVSLAPMVAIASAFGVAGAVGLPGLFVLEALGSPRGGAMALGIGLLGGTTAVAGLWLWALRRRYRSLEYRVYPTGVLVYNRRHDTVAQFVPFRHVEQFQLSRGPLSRCFGVGTVRIERTTYGGNLRTVFSNGASENSETAGLLLRAVPEARDAYERIDRWCQEESEQGLADTLRESLSSLLVDD